MEFIQPLLFWIIAIVTGLCAVAVVVSQNIVRSATWLLFTLAGTSGIFFLLGADLVGAVQLLVYVGGTLVLVVFGVMLTAQGPFVNIKISGAEWAISALVGILLLSVLVVGIGAVGIPSPPKDFAVGKFAPEHCLVIESAPYVKLRADFEAKGITAEEFDRDKKALDRAQPANSSYSSVIGEGFLGVGVADPAHEEMVGRVKQTVRANYLLPFEIVSVHLLVVLIGAAYLARAKRRRSVTL